ncbi:hypothetical protein PG997_008472 [Apiospora hydei]|uniref:protein-ribulosamine 3-kinase n=1 Tax=Apiospora hydei TaxID=1337664 RepID=A0ABR1WAX8_9PEZI
MRALREAMPELTPLPIGTGQYASDPDKFFYLCEFRDLVEDVPDIKDFSSMVAELHKRGVSPDGKFGFPVMETAFAVEEESQGADADMQALRVAIMTKVIPRLLRPMETGGRSLVPRLVHSDLWHGNVAVDVNTGLPVIFDGIALYAHNEYELAPWRPTRHNIGRPYINEYLKHAAVTDPAEDFEDRNLLYCM